MKITKLLLVSLVVAASGALAQVPISGLPPAVTPLTGSEIMILNQNSFTRQTPISSLTSIVPPITAPFVLQSASPTLTNSRVLIGTANEVIITDGGPLGNLTLATPQPIGLLNSPTFAGLTLTGLNGILIGHGASPLTVFGGVTCVNQFLRSLSTAGVGVCNSVANTDLVNSSVTYNGVNVALGGSGTLILASSNFANQGSATTVLHGNAAGNPSWAQVNLASEVTGTLPAGGGGTGNNTYVVGDTLYASAVSTLSRLAGNTSATKQFLTQTGSGAASAAPVWGVIAAGDLPGSFAGFANPTANVGLSVVNGSAATAMRSDAAPALSQAIVPTWTGTHTFSATSPLTILSATGAAADTKNWDTRLTSAGNWALSTATDAAPSTPVKDALTASRTGTAISSIALGNATDLPAITENGITVTPFSGTFTFTITGCTTSPTGTGTYFRVGQMVTLALPSITCTSNATTFTYTGLPAVLQPSGAVSGGTQIISVAWGEDNTVVLTSNVACSIAAGSGTVTFFKNGNSSGWTNGGTKGLPNVTTINYIAN